MGDLKQKTFGLGNQSNVPMDSIPYKEVTETKNLPKANGKGVLIMMSGWLTATFGSGTATMKPGGILKNLLSEIQVKDYKGDLVVTTVGQSRFHTRRMNGKEAPSLYQQNSQVLSSPSVGLYTGNLTTAQAVAVQESIYIPFECEIAEANFLDTLLHYNGKNENVIKLVLGKLSGLLDTASTATPTWTHDLKFDINLLTTEHSGQSHRWVRSWKEELVASSTSKKTIDISQVENLAGVMFEITKSQTGGYRSPITFADAQKIVVNIIGKKNGVTTVIRQDETLASLAYNDLSKKKIDAIVDGYSYANLINGNLLDSALRNDYTELLINFNFPSSLDYTIPFNVRSYIDDIDRSDM